MNQYTGKKSFCQDIAAAHDICALRDIDVESSGTDFNRKVGEKNVEVAGFRVHVNNTEDGELRNITLYNAGRDILSNLRLYRGSDQVAAGEKLGLIRSTSKLPR